MFENVKTYLNRFEKMGIPGMDISVYYQGKEVFREYRGVSDEQGTPTNGGEIYNFYSCSKPITCVAALKLTEQGKIRLDDDVAEYLPAFRDMTVKQGGSIQKAEKKMKLRHLFTMTAGLNYAVDTEEIRQGKRETDGKCATVEMMDYVAKMPLEFEPGESWKYSLCHDVLAAVVEVASGKRFGLYVKENIFDPLDIRGTTFLYPEEELQKISAQYRGDGKGGYENIGRHIYTHKYGELYESGGAGAIGTVNDYVKFLEGLRKGKLLSEATLALLQTDHLSEWQRKAYVYAEKVGYGYGLGVRVPSKGYPRTDIGWGGAAGAYGAMDRKNAISVFFAEHVIGAPNSDLRRDLIEAVKLDLGLDAYQASMRCDGNGSGNVSF